ncbi:immunoglobulin domain-containing protein isoform X2 [Hemibagrus wyckioides]|uniref:immunoglobulin domain-containing protein isoform X2 n=1 Tax=Hemibagrus wyckioides TaxID=337641 RepID=UPI00266C456B|nr:immunoglobulin domain-containing protein isoform X2 [Hemibagrus wyckioides]
MSKNILCVFFIVSFLQTGISNNRITITLSQEGDNIIVTCVLAGNDSLTQVNWDKVQGSNHTKLGIFHPNEGTYIFPEHSGKVKIQGQETPLASSGLFSQKEALNESGLICCQFITFPSGSIKQCTDLSDAAISVLISAAEPHGAGRKQGLFGQFGALTVGCILSLLFLIITIFTCWRCFCRRQVLEIQHEYRDQSTISEMYTEEAREVQPTPSPSGFDPTKLYAKIKEDLYYGRLWKSYQGKARVATQGCLAGSRQIYYRLGENPLSQREQEHNPKIPPATSTPSSNSGI